MPDDIEKRLRRAAERAVNRELLLAAADEIDALHEKLAAITGSAAERNALYVLGMMALLVDEQHEDEDVLACMKRVLEKLAEAERERDMFKRHHEQDEKNARVSYNLQVAAERERDKAQRWLEAAPREILNGLVEEGFIDDDVAANVDDAKRIILVALAATEPEEPSAPSDEGPVYHSVVDATKQAIREVCEPPPKASAPEESE